MEAQWTMPNEVLDAFSARSADGRVAVKLPSTSPMYAEEFCCAHRNVGVELAVERRQNRGER
jgi:hypothetical protein